MISLNTNRFGALEVDEQKIIHFPDGIIGFPALKRYVLLDYKDTDVKWLQCVDDPDIAFIVAPPRKFFKDFAVQVDSVTRAALSLKDDADLALLVILRVENGEVIANLEGPLAINSRLMTGIQTVAETSTS